MLWDGKNYAYNARPPVNTEKYIGGTKLATDISILETNFNPSLIVTKIWEILELELVVDTNLTGKFKQKERREGAFNEN